MSDEAHTGKNVSEKSDPCDPKNVYETAKQFWKMFKTHEPDIYNNILKRNENDYNKSVNIVTQITKELCIDTNVGIYFGIDIRNGMNLNERKDYVEIIISPLFQKKNQSLVIALFNESFNCNLPKYWSVIKYKFHRPSYIHTITLNYTNKNDGLDNVEITKNHFYFHPILNERKTKISILLFIDDDISPYLIKKENHKERELWFPIDNGVHAILDSAIGEYNLLNAIDKIEIHLKSDVDKDEFKDVQLRKLETIIDDIELIHNHSLSKFHTCSRCEYSNKQVKLYICKCRKVYYCDSICQKAHRELHLLGGCK